MLSIEDLIEHVGHLAQQGHVAGARLMADEALQRDPLAGHLAHATIAGALNDLPTLSLHVELAERLDPENPRVVHARVMRALLTKDFVGAEVDARRAVALDDSVRSWRGLASVLFATGKSIDAERTLRELLSRHDDAEARLLLARAKAQRGDHAGALAEQAKAFLLAPSDVRPLSQTVAAYRDAGWPIGVLMLARVTRGGEHPPEVQVLLDLVCLQMLARIGENPVRDMLAVDDETVSNVVSASAGLSAEVQLRVARTLLEHRRGEVATILGRLDHARLAPAERAEVAFCEGLAHAQRRRSDEAMAAYARAVDLSAEHWEAACNFVNLCLEKRTPELLAKAGAIIDRVPEATRRLQVVMTFNEAVWLDAVGRPADARRLVAWLQEAPTGNLAGMIETLAQRLAKTPMWMA